MKNVLGISCFYHDSTACLLKDGVIAAALQEERFSRIKHDARFPARAVEAALRLSQLSPGDIDAVVFYEKPFLKFERLLETALNFAPQGFLNFSKAMPLWLKDKLFQRDILLRDLEKLGFARRPFKDRIFFSDHHRSHAASAFYPSPFLDAAIMTLDGVGEWKTTSLAVGAEHRITNLQHLDFPHSLGLLYSAFTTYCGFKVNSGEYKLMGLAPYGRGRFKETILKNLVDLRADGSFRLNMKYFSFHVADRMTNKEFDQLFGGSQRSPDGPLLPIHMDLARSIQEVLEEIVLHMARHLHGLTQSRNLCMAGGVALNCVANGRLRREGPFQDIWIQPAAGDAGGALGAALAFWNDQRQKPHAIHDGPTKRDAMGGALLGTIYEDDEITAALGAADLPFERFADSDTVIQATAGYLAAGHAVGWFQGRMEFGPRSLGARSVLASPLIPGTQKRLNMKIKFRESFRPFAPAVLAEDADQWFDIENSSPYMLETAQVKSVHLVHQKLDPSLLGLDLLNQERSTISAVTHVDGSARVQTVHADTNPRFHSLLREFKNLTGCPVLVNTSFNVRGEPIVESPQDAIRCFLGTDLDVLVLGNCLVRKTNIPAAKLQAYHKSFDPD